MRSVWWAIGGLTLALLLALSAAVTWLMTTQSGLHWAAALAERYSPVAIHYERLEGRLIGPIGTETLRVRTADVTVRIDRADLDWRPRALLWGQVHVRSVNASGIAIETAGAEPVPPAEPAPALALPDAWAPPLGLRLDAVRLEGIRVRAPDLAIAVDRLAFGLRVGADGARLSDLVLVSPHGRVRGRLRVGADKPFALDGRLDWRVAAPLEELGAMAGGLELAGDLRQPRGRLRWREPAPATLDGWVRPFDPELPWHAALELPERDLRAWWGPAPAVSAGASLTLAGTSDRASAQGRMSAAGLPTGRLDARMRLESTPERLVIERLELRAAERPQAHTRVAGEIDWADGAPAFDLEASWQDLAWPLQAPDVRSASGRLRLTGRPDGYRIEGQATVAAPGWDQPPAELSWHARGSLEALAHFELQGEWRQARLEAVGAGRWAGARHGRVRLDVAGVDPSRWGAGPEGDIAATLALQASETATGWSGQGDLVALQGVIAGRPITGSGRVGFDGSRWRVERLAVRAADARFRADGTLAERAEVTWTLAVPDLTQLVPDYAGRIDARGAITGALTEPRARLDVAAEGVNGPIGQFDSARLRGQVTTVANEISDLRLVAAGAEVEGWAIERLEADLQGTPEAHSLEAVVRHERGSMRLRLAGALAGTNWRGELARGDLRIDRGAPWSLEQAQSVVWRDGVLRLGRGCWTSEGARVCLEGRVAGERFRAHVDAAAVPLARVGAYWRPELDYTGRFDLDLAVASDGTAVTGEARLSTTRGAVEGVIGDEPETLFAFGAGEAAVSLGPEQVAVRADWPLAADGRLEGHLRLARQAPHALDGALSARVSQLGLVSALVPSLEPIEARLDADFAVGGSVEQPEITGGMEMATGELHVVPLGLRLQGIEARVSSVADGMDVRLRVSSGGGRGELSARARRDPAGAWRASGRLIGTELLVADRPDLALTATPQLDWTMSQREVSVTGSVQVPMARITPRDLSRAVRPSPDAVIVHPDRGTPDAAATPPGWTVRADVAVVPGDDVRIDAFGLRGRVAGSLRLIEEPGQPTAALGELKIEEGTYSIYRQTLAIERGRVIYSGGPVTNPGLDVRAVRRPRNLVVGVNVRGTLQNPRAELFSEPPMPESQQLSYLVVGVPLGETSSAEGETLAAATSLLAGSKQTSQLAGRVGIDEIEVESGGPGEGTSVVLGRYLSPRLYIGYGIGLLQEANSVRLRYELTDLWSLEGQSGTHSSADLLYTIEVDSSADAVPPQLRRPASDGAGESSE